MVISFLSLSRIKKILHENGSDKRGNDLEAKPILEDGVVTNLESQLETRGVQAEGAVIKFKWQLETWCV